MMRRLGVAIAALLPLVAGACDVCAGTPSCRQLPEISVGGQFIERQSGDPVAGVVVKFARSSGPEMTADTVTAVTDGQGFFQLRAPLLQGGVVHGELVVEPPAPHLPYRIPDIVIPGNTLRGDGQNLGRLVVNPYLLLIGHVRDRETLAPIQGATVFMRRIGGGQAEADSVTFTTDFGGQFSWEPRILDPGPIVVEFEITVTGRPRTYKVQRVLALQYRDNAYTFAILPVGWGLSYGGRSIRRGSEENLTGTIVHFERISGIAVDPASATLPLDAIGGFVIPSRPSEEGALIGEIRVTPPAPMPPETTRVELRTSDDDERVFLGFFRYGAQAYLKAELRDAATGAALPQGTTVVMRRTGGVALDWPSAPADWNRRAVRDSGRLEFQAPAADTGMMQFEMIVEPGAQFLPDTIRNIAIPSHYSDSASLSATYQVRRRPAP